MLAGFLILFSRSSILSGAARAQSCGFVTCPKLAEHSWQRCVSIGVFGRDVPDMILRQVSELNMSESVGSGIVVLFLKHLTQPKGVSRIFCLLADSIAARVPEVSRPRSKRTQPNGVSRFHLGFAICASCSSRVPRPNDYTH